MRKLIFIAIGMITFLTIIYFNTPAKEETKKTKPLAVVSFSILEDLVKNICGDRYDVITIVGRNSDAHVYRPKPQTSKLISNADIIFINGMGFEGWINKLISSTGYNGPIITTTTGLQPTANIDPHAWNDVQNVKLYVENIAQAFIAQDPVNKNIYINNKNQYIKKLCILDAEIKNSINKIPANKRKFVTAHDAFKYFSRAYGVEVLSPMGVSTEQEASAKDVVKLIDYIKSAKIKTVFVENITNEKLIRQIAEETGASLGGTLYTDALSENDEPAPTYIKMMRHNFQLLYKSMID